MTNISAESTLIIASNLTVASILRGITIFQTNEKPIKETEQYIFDKFRAIADLCCSIKGICRGAACCALIWAGQGLPIPKNIFLKTILTEEGQ